MNLLHEIGSHLSGLEQLKVMMTNDLCPGIGKTLDIRLIEAEEGRVVLGATPDVHLYNPIGTLHGGFGATMLDFACGYALLSKLTPGMGFRYLKETETVEFGEIYAFVGENFVVAVRHRGGPSVVGAAALRLRPACSEPREVGGS
jgi:acyl-coenzyme A thioesterase PaaI-like protein